MQCPYCHTALAESTVECPSCQLSLATACALLGPVPRLARGLNDTVGVFDSSGGKKIRAALAGLTRRFPQVDMHVISRHFDPQFPVSTHLFWLFNQGEFCTSDKKGGKNRTVLLAVDPNSGQVGMMVGYGLEPFLPQKALDHTLEKAQPSLGAGDYAKAIVVVIDALGELMAGVCEGLEETLGIAPQQPSETQKF